jgi:hypothetical protein
MGGSEENCREVNPLQIKARMSTANWNAVDGASPILRRRERINDSTDSNERVGEFADSSGECQSFPGP